MDTPTPQSIALVTGGNKGIGLEAARQLADAGFHVLLGARDGARGQAAAQALQARGYDVTFLELDVTDDSSVDAARRQIEAQFGKLDVLVNNAGVNFEYDNGTLISDPATALLEQTYAVNVFGLHRMMHHFADLIAAAHGRIINVSSGLGSQTNRTNPNHPWYGYLTPAYISSKSAVTALSVAYAQLLGPRGVAVIAVCPGHVRTDMGGEAAPRSVEQGASIITQMATMASPPNGAYLDENGPIGW
jgi:NAD(P)-dependent dehydrogenase (short-subunit alcohol dehydrogenase family)